MNDRTLSWGLDLSTNPKKCAAVAIRWDAGRPKVVDVRTHLRPDQIVELILQEPGQFAVDVPFGWPDTFVQFVVDHRSRAQRPPGDRDAWRKETLARRATDQELAIRYGAIPLPASFDRLGKTAVMWSAIEFDLAAKGLQIDRSGLTGHVCETYPTAALAAWSLEKKKPSVDYIARAFPFLDTSDWADALAASDDVRDALICSLTARAVVLGVTDQPTDVDQAGREGWIHVHPGDPRALLGPGPHPWLLMRLHVPTAEQLAEDGPKKTFDFWRMDGSQVDSLRDFFPGEDELDRAARIINYSYPAAVPAKLSHEAWKVATAP